LITVMKNKKGKTTKEDEVFCRTIAVSIANGVRYIVQENGSEKNLEKRLRYFLDFMKTSFLNEVEK